MLSRWLIIVALSLGNLLLIAHAVIPHHHHEGVVCYHQDEEADEEEHARESTNDHHQGDPFDSDCLLKQVYILPPGQTQLSNPVVKLKLASHAQFTISIKAAPVPEPDYRCFKILALDYPLRQIRPDQSLHGLRAPPLV